VKHVAVELVHVLGPQDAGVRQGGGDGFDFVAAVSIAGSERDGDAGE